MSATHRHGHDRLGHDRHDHDRHDHADDEGHESRLPVRAQPRAVDLAAGVREPAIGTAQLPMTQPLEAASAPSLRRRLRRALWTLPVGAGLWAILSGGAADSWAFGAPAVLAASAIAFANAPAARWRLSPAGALRFSVFFAVQSVRGALDVAYRAVAWRMPLEPGFHLYRLRLPVGAPRIVFANTISLLPGTLTAELHGDHVVVHALDTGMDVAGELVVLEERVRDLFALAMLPRPATITAEVLP